MSNKYYIFFRTVPLIVFCLFLSSCQTTNSNGKIEYSTFFTPAGHVEDLLRTQAIDQASTVYEENLQFFNDPKSTNSFGENKPKIVASKLATVLSDRYKSRANRALVLLNTIKWPSEFSAWKEMKTVLITAKSLLESINEHEILSEASYKPEYLKILTVKHNELMENIETAAPDQFAKFDLSTSVNFAQVYPIKLKPKKFFMEQTDLWKSKVSELNTNQLEVVYSQYKGDLSDSIKHHISDLFFRAKLKNSSQKSKLRSILDAVKKAHEIELPIIKIPDSSVALIEVTSRTLLKEGQIEFPTSVDIDIPLDAHKLEVEKAFNSPITANADLIVLIDIAAARTERNISKQVNVTSKYQTGTRTEPNPQYNIAQNEVNNARMEVQRAAMGSMSADSQYCQGIGCLAKAFAQIAAAAAQSKANENLQLSMSQLQSTSLTISTPVYKPYRFKKSVINTTKEAAVNYYVIDRISNTYLKDTFEAKQSQSFKVAYGIVEEDPDKYSHLSDMDKEEDVTKFENSALGIKLSDILTQFLSKQSDVKKLSKLSNIRKQILADKNIALAKYKKKQFTSSPHKDPRFKSVVMVFNPGGGLGTGFFVRDDLILTNYHVVEGSKFVEMKLFSGQETFGKVIASDIRLDLSLIKSQARGPVVSFYQKNELPLGETVEVIGHPKGLDFTITRGVVSALRKKESLYMRGGKKVMLIQTDAAINPGNSGGPLFLKDKVIGVNQQKLVATELEGLNFSIHYSEILEFLQKNNVNTGS
jgi:serine protease Do